MDESSTLQNALTSMTKKHLKTLLVQSPYSSTNSTNPFPNTGFSRKQMGNNPSIRLANSQVSPTHLKVGSLAQ